MRTPREILLHRHRAAEPELDAISRAVVAQLNTNAKPEPSPRLVMLLLGLPGNFWREVVRPALRLWAGLAAVWVVILLANLDFRAGAVPPNSLSLAMTFSEQEQVIAELTERSEKADPPKPQAPQPRSEHRGEFLMI